MHKANVLQPCPCGMGMNYENCCQPLILGLHRAETAPELLRSRYTAFVVNKIDYLLTTHHPETVHEVSRQSISEWAQSRWLGLEIVKTEKGTKDDDEGSVDFIARYEQGGKSYAHAESSLFKKHEGQWYFYNVLKTPPIKRENKLGRNELCFCGSGQKYKNCHGR